MSRLKGIVHDSGIEAAFGQDNEADCLLLVNGCLRACLEEELRKDANPQRWVSVEGSHLDYRPVAEDELPQAVWEKIQERLAQAFRMICL